MRKLMLVLAVAVIGLLLIATIAAYWFFSGDGVRRAIEQQASAWLGQPVKVGAAHGKIFPRAAITLSDVRVGEPARLALGEVQLSTDLRALFDRTIDDATVTISKSRIEMPLPFELPASDDAAATSSQNTSSNSGIRIVSVRAISLDDIRLVSRGREVRVSADSSLNGDRLTLRRFDATSGTTALSASGDVNLAPSIEARLTVKANKLDVDELLALADAFTPPQTRASPGRSAPAKITARISAEQANAGGIEVRQFSTELEVNGDRIALSPLTFQIFGGRYQGSLNAQLGKALALTIRSRLQDLDVAQIAAFGGSPDTVSGTLTGAGTFSGTGADVAGVLSGARGMGTATVMNGTVRRLNLLRTVVLFFGRPSPDAGKGDDRFDRIDATFSLANRIFRADAFALHSPDADVVGSGTLNSATQGLDGALDLSLSEELSKQAGTDLIRFTREGNRVVLPARISGTISAPRITIDAAAAAKRGLRNETQRRLKGLLDGFKLR